jgi:hypothetical protein
MAVAAYTYDKLPADEQQALPNEGHIVAALEWAEPIRTTFPHQEMPSTRSRISPAGAWFLTWTARAMV